MPFRNKSQLFMIIKKTIKAGTIKFAKLTVNLGVDGGLLARIIGSGYGWGWIVTSSVRLTQR